MQEEFIIDDGGVLPDPEPIIPCGIYGRVIHSYDIFSFLDIGEPDGGGYSIATVGFLSKNNIISNHVLKKIYKESHRDELALTPETGLHTFMDISKNGNYAKDYYIIVHQGQEERIGINNDGSYISYYSYVKGFYSDKPDIFDTLPECSGYKLSQSGTTEKTVSHVLENTIFWNQSFIILVILGVFISMILGSIFYRIFLSKR